MSNRQLEEYLANEHVYYDNIMHSPAYTAHETAQKAHVSGKEFAKTVIVKLDGKLAMIVLCANDKINFGKLEKETGTHHAELASEREFEDQFEGCEVGAMHPFGNLYGMDVYVDEHLTHEDEIAFNAGSHSELMRVAYDDFARCAHAKVLHAA